MDKKQKSARKDWAMVSHETMCEFCGNAGIDGNCQCLCDKCEMHPKECECEDDSAWYITDE